VDQRETVHVPTLPQAKKYFMVSVLGQFISFCPRPKNIFAQGQKIFLLPSRGATKYTDERQT
jgi:hypothetical protein